MISKTCAVLLISYLLGHAGSAWALSVTTPTRIAIGATQKLLSAPPLPTLDAGGKLTVSPALGYLTASTEGSYVQPASDPNASNPTNGYTAHYDGKLEGLSWGSA